MPVQQETRQPVNVLLWREAAGQCPRTRYWFENCWCLLNPRIFGHAPGCQCYDPDCCCDPCFARRIEHEQGR